VSGAAVAPRDDAVVAFTAAGGWRVVVAPRPDSTTVALRYLVAAGGRHDGALPGLSRLVAHLVYDARAPRRRDLFGALAALGAEAASITTREYAEFCAVAPAAEQAALLRLVPQLARPPLLSPAVVARERAALAAALAAPVPSSAVLWDLLLAALWGDHALARSPGGSAASVAALQSSQLAAHHAARYTPAHTVLAAAGACTVEAVRAAADLLPRASAPSDTRGISRPAAGRSSVGRSTVGSEPGSAPLPYSEPSPDAVEPVTGPPSFQGPADRYQWTPGTVAQVAVAVPVPGMAHPDRSALRLLDYLLGRGGSARLYQALRVRRQLVYSCGSVYMPYADVGVFAAQAVCAPARARTVARALADSLLGLAARPPSAAELAAAQTRYAGNLQRVFETNASLTAILGVETLLATWEPFAVAASRVAAVTPGEVAAVARAYLAPERLVRVTIGPLDPVRAD